MLNYWIELKIYKNIPEVCVYVGVNFQVNRSSERTCDIGQNRLYEFCYLLPFDLWTFYLAKILFLRGYESLFCEFSSSTRILFFGKLTYVLKEEDTNIIRGIPQIYNDNRNIKQQMAIG